MRAREREINFSAAAVTNPIFFFFFFSFFFLFELISTHIILKFGFVCFSAFLHFRTLLLARGEEGGKSFRAAKKLTSLW